MALNYNSVQKNIIHYLYLHINIDICSNAKNFNNIVMLIQSSSVRSKKVPVHKEYPVIWGQGGKNMSQCFELSFLCEIIKRH